MRDSIAFTDDESVILTAGRGMGFCGFFEPSFFIAL